MKGEHISWLTGRRAKAKGSASFKRLDTGNSVLGQSFSQMLGAYSCLLSSLGAWGYRPAAASTCLLVHFQEPWIRPALHTWMDTSLLLPTQEPWRNSQGRLGFRQLPFLSPYSEREASLGTDSLFEISQICLIKILSEISHWLHLECLRVKSFFPCIINSLPLWR